MNTLAPPVARCPSCGGWLARRALYPTERPTIALVCGLCAWDGEIIAGRLVPITRPASTLTDADLRRERHAQAVEAGTVRRRGEGR